MRVSQSEIAVRAGVDRTTVNKILNHHPAYQANKHTIAKVFKAAKELGYDISLLRRAPERRIAERKKVDLRVGLTLSLRNGTVHDSGTARLRDLSLTGALLGDLNTETRLIPTVPFSAKITILQGTLKGVTVDAEFMRFESHDRLDFGVRFDRLSRKAEREFSACLGIKKGARNVG